MMGTNLPNVRVSTDTNLAMVEDPTPDLGAGMDQLKFVRPADIEAQSFKILSDELDGQGIDLSDVDPATALVIKRVIHTTADFEFARTLCFSPQAVELGIDALRAGAHVVTDTTMAAAGINKRVLAKLGGEVHTFVADKDVAEEARERGLTRSAVSMERAARLAGPLVFAIGNAPTALVRLHAMVANGTMPVPALVIGVPVGFVNVVESKELVLQSDVPHIVARGRKGGSTVAAAIVNALLYQTR